MFSSIKNQEWQLRILILAVEDTNSTIWTSLNRKRLSAKLVNV